MRSKDNGNPGVCASNLLQIVRGEVPYERVKGIDARIVDRPYGSAESAIRQDAEWLIETYEPRVTINDIAVKPSDAVSGGFAVTADIKEKGES